MVIAICHPELVRDAEPKGTKREATTTPAYANWGGARSPTSAG